MCIRDSCRGCATRWTSCGCSCRRRPSARNPTLAASPTASSSCPRRPRYQRPLRSWSTRPRHRQPRRLSRRHAARRSPRLPSSTVLIWVLALWCACTRYRGPAAGVKNDHRCGFSRYVYIFPTTYRILCPCRNRSTKHLHYGRSSERRLSSLASICATSSAPSKTSKKGIVRTPRAL